jgi:hypothetical protein
MRMRHRRLLAGAGALSCAVLAAVPAAASTQQSVTFRAPVFVDGQLAGSEGFVLFAAKSHRLIYATHEGTTLLLRGGLTGAPSGDGDYVTTYRNQVNMWTSADDGSSWQRVDWNGSGFFTGPDHNLGFSDPDLTEDGAGNTYVAGIDLANDALVSSPDGGRTWPTGTVQCHEGDRPWLAGGKGREVFLASNSEQYGHIVVRSTDGGATCSSAFATGEVNGWTGYGKLVYDEKTDTIYEAAVKGDQLGMIALRHATSKFDSGTPGSFDAHPAVTATTFNTFWKAQVAQDDAGTLYLTWTTDDRKSGTSGGCSNAATPTANSVLLTHSTDDGRTWSTPTVLARPGTTVNWPWIVAGAPGRVAVAWYAYDRIVDLNCAPADAKMGVRLAMIRDASTAHPRLSTTDPIGRPVHVGPVCTNGTACVATGQDRRLGEFFTLAPDANGCVMVATGDTTRTDPVTGAQLPTARPLFTVQTSGPSLTGGSCAAATHVVQSSSASGATARRSSAARLPATGGPVLLPLAGLLVVAAGLAARRVRRRG